jgi:hypothetical protein
LPIKWAIPKNGHSSTSFQPAQQADTPAAHGLEELFDLGLLAAFEWSSKVNKLAWLRLQVLAVVKQVLLVNPKWKL